MLTTTQTIEFCSTDFDKEVVHLLNYARTKLLTQMPRQLKMTSYLRLCCLAIRKLRQEPRLVGKLGLNEAFDDSYSHLLQALCNHNPEWWRHCWSSDRGILKSDDPTIDNLLQPLEYFVETYTCKSSSNQKLS
ncbi:hypothetical protein [Leptolyngbya sp. FACHB-541]|uniref:hypothetical protein n=1 Tax=Leptolyngbya sp. FACHB-541 TaxID=2692810 RepID=UPI001688754D|nr:hypothetical protein [Leptolyngbya sp. FACHB-541]